MSRFYSDRFDLFSKYPNLIRHDEFNIKKCRKNDQYARWTSDEDVFNSIARYVVFLCDESSPLGGERQTFKAKDKAMSEAGVPEDFRDELVKRDNILAVAMMVRFLRYQNNHKMTELVAKRELFYQIAEEMSTKITAEIGDDKQTRAYQVRLKMSQDMAGLRKDIEQLEIELFGQDSGLAKSVMDEEDKQIVSGAVEEHSVKSIHDL